MNSTNTSAYLLKNLPSEYLNIITVLFNKCVENGTFFNKGKQAKGICISKDGMYPTKDRVFDQFLFFLTSENGWKELLLKELKNGAMKMVFILMNNQDLLRIGDYKQELYLS